MSRVSVVVPSYNQGKFITNCLNSILAQSKKPYEIIVADDHSTDNTKEIIKPYLKKTNKIKFIRHKKNLGSYNFTYNTGVRNAKGDYIIIVSADDWLLPTVLEEESRVLDENPKIGMVYSQAFDVIDGKKVLKMPSPAGKISYVARKNDFELLLTKGDFIPSINALVRKSVFKKVGLFDTNLRYMADYEMWIRISRLFGLAYIAKPLTAYRIHGQNLHLNSDFHKRNEHEFFYILNKYLLNKKLTKSLNETKKIALRNYYLTICANAIFQKDQKRAANFWLKAFREKPTGLFTWKMIQPAYFTAREFLKETLPSKRSSPHGT